MRGAVGIFVGTPFLHIRRTRTSTVANTYVNVSLAVVMTAMSFVSGGFSMKASIQAVAAEAGVSISTVSRTFAKPNLVLPETRSKVMAAAEKLDYRISRSAAALPQQRSHAHHTELILWQTHGGQRGMHVRGNHFLIIEPNHGDIIRSRQSGRRRCRRGPAYRSRRPRPAGRSRSSGRSGWR